MIDIKILRSNFDILKEKILLKDPSFNIDELLKRYEEYSCEKINFELILKEQNDLSKKWNTEKNISSIKSESEAIQEKIKTSKASLEKKEQLFNEIYLACPNIPDDTIPIGDKTKNKVIKTFGTDKKFDFTALSHVELFKNSGGVNFKLGTSLSKSGFIFYESNITWMIYRLCNIFLKHNESFGFKVCLPPYLLSEKVLQNAGNFPRFKDEVFCSTKDELFLLPTAEVAINSIHEDEILDEKILPLRYTAWTGCFRREAGGYGSHERGLIRIHEFEKVEIFSFVSPEKSEEEHEYILNCAEKILQKFNLKYRISLLSTQDCSFSSAKTYDIELWLPGQNEFREISSISNCTDFQTRRSKTRIFKSKKNILAHTLNGSCFALPRFIIGLIENYQDKNGTICYKEIFDLISFIEKSLLI
jgi:seryl-tRNA synthetase